MRSYSDHVKKNPEEPQKLPVFQQHIGGAITMKAKREWKSRRSDNQKPKKMNVKK